MHELSIAEGLVRQALAGLKEHAGGRKVTGLHVEVGELSGVVPELLASAFPLAAEGTALAGAKLHIKKVAVEFACLRCGKRFGRGAVKCPACGSDDVELAAGREANLTALEVEDEE